MNGRLYGIGVGPGDPELLTLKAKRILESVEYVAVPKTKMEKESLAQTIIKPVVDIKGELLELVFPMSYEQGVLDESWQKAVEIIKDKLEAGKDVAFITLGDPTVYSTYIYVHKSIKASGFQCEIVPGITSFCASAARVGISLAENKETLAIVPSAYKDENFDKVIEQFDNIVLMKVSGDYDGVMQRLKDKDLLDKTVQISCCGMKEERIIYDMSQIQVKKPSYFTTMLIKKNGVNGI